MEYNSTDTAAEGRPTRATTVTGAPRKRVAAACSFCRGRKIKCNNERPVCSNCRIYGKSCVFEPIDEAERSKNRPRPSRVEARRKQKAAQQAEPSATATEESETTQVDTDGSRSVSRIVFSPNGISSYHGRTSALFEEAAPEQRHPGAPQPRMPSDWVQKSLVAEAAQQSKRTKRASSKLT
jgi:hypothetical protein